MFKNLEQKKKLTSKVAFVTGGSRGIGSGIVRRLAADGAGVAFTYVGSKDRAEELVRVVKEEGGRAFAIKADSSLADDVTRAVEATVKEFGRLDILVNNAGVATIAPVEEFSLAEFDRIMNINVRGVFLATQAALRHIGQGGRIINIGSVNSDAVPFAGASVYAMSKGAVASFTRGLARDLAPRGITVNNVQPGPIETEMNPATGPFADVMHSFMALKHHGKVEDVGSLVAFLASDEAGFITGTGIKVDGGFDA